MNLWDKVTGSDMTRMLRAFETRAGKLPSDFQSAWDDIKECLYPYSDFTGRNLMSVFDGVLGLLEESAADGQSAGDVLGEDIKGFCSALVSGEGAKSYRDKWREQLNKNVARKLGL